MDEIQKAIYQKVIGQILRFVLNMIAAYLLFIGVDKDSKNEFVEVTVNVVTPLIIIGAVQFYAFLQKRTAEYRAHYALAANPNTTTLAEVDALVAERTPAVI